MMEMAGELEKFLQYGEGVKHIYIYYIYILYVYIHIKPLYTYKTFV